MRYPTVVDAFKRVVTGQHLAADLDRQMRGSRYYRHYCPDRSVWICRAGELGSSDFRLAFKPH